MSTEIDITSTGSDITVLPPARPMQADAVGQLMAHAQAMTAAKQLADGLCATDLVPKDYKGKPDNGAAAILYGAELGLNPIQSLQQIFIVHGSPAIYARTAVALVMRHGISVRTLESSDDSVTVEVSDPRTGHVETCTWDYARAQKAGYTGNKKYDTDPQAMLYAKAAMEGCRKVAPDILLGIPMSREELDLDAPTPVRSERVQARGVAALREAAERSGAASEKSGESEPEAESGRRKWLNRMFALLSDAQCTDRQDQLIVISSLAGQHYGELLEHRDGVTDDQLRRIVTTLHDWKQSGQLDANVTDLMNAWVAAVSDSTTTEK